MVAGRSRICTVHFLADLMATGSRAPHGAQRNTSESGQTLPSRHGEPAPRLPHERDESSDSQTGIRDKRVEQAARDLANGQQDTGRTPVVTELARREFPDAKKAKSSS